MALPTGSAFLQAFQDLELLPLPLDVTGPCLFEQRLLQLRIQLGEALYVLFWILDLVKTRGDLLLQWHPGKLFRGGDPATTTTINCGHLSQWITSLFGLRPAEPALLALSLDEGLPLWCNRWFRPWQQDTASLKPIQSRPADVAI
jgi:hypothetical protein